MNLTEKLQNEYVEKFDKWWVDMLFKSMDTGKVITGEKVCDFISDLVAEVVEETEKRVREEIAEKVNRVEVIDHNGRAWGIWQDGIKVKIDLQDEGRTLKLFVTQPKEEK